MLFVVVVAVPHWWDFLRWGIGSCIVPFIFVTLCSSNRKKNKTNKKNLYLLKLSRGQTVPTCWDGLTWMLRALPTCCPSRQHVGEAANIIEHVQ